MEAKAQRKTKKSKTRKVSEDSDQHDQAVESVDNVQDDSTLTNTEQRLERLKKFNKYVKRTQKKIVLDKAQVKKAAKALKKYSKELIQKNSLNLLEQEDKFISVNILMTQVPKKYSPKPISIPIPNPIYGPKYDTRALMFVKDPETAFKSKIEELNLP